MAYIDNKGFLHGRCGDKIYTVYNKKQIVRGLPKKTQIPPTSAQLIQREKFGLAVKLSQAFRPLFLWATSLYSRTGIRHLIAHILKDVLSIKHDGYTVDYSKLYLLKGVLPLYKITSFSSNFVGTISLEWSQLQDSYAAQHTKIALIIYQPELHLMQHLVEPKISGQGLALFSLTEAFVGHDIHCWYYFYTPNPELNLPLKDTDYSSSQYLGKIKV